MDQSHLLKLCQKSKNLRCCYAELDQVQTENVVGRLANATLAEFNDINVKIDVLVDSQIRTDETLRNLIAAIDRYFSEGRNSK